MVLVFPYDNPGKTVYILTREEQVWAMDREGTSYGAVPRLSTSTMRHESLPVGLNETTDIFVPPKETSPTLTAHHEVVEDQMKNMDPVRQGTLVKFVFPLYYSVLLRSLILLQFLVKEKVYIMVHSQMQKCGNEANTLLCLMVLQVYKPLALPVQVGSCTVLCAKSITQSTCKNE